MKQKFISLFSGAMGLDIGLEKSGHWECAFAMDNDKDAINTIKANRPDLPIFEGSIENLSGKEIKEASHLTNGTGITLVVGGPPCQAFSVFGKRNGLNDSRGRLVFEFVRMIKELQPKMFLMENVRGLLSMPLIPANQKGKVDGEPYMFKNGSLIRTLFDEFNKLGYHVDCYVVNSVNYGAPQIRERVLLIGNKSNMFADFPNPMYSNRPNDNLPPFKTLGDVIGPKSGFIDNDDDLMNFSSRKLGYLKDIPPGGNWRSMPVEMQKESMGKSWYLKGGRSAYWRRLSFEFPSPTVVTMPNHAGTSMCHPDETRAITVGEAAAIQEFPSDWKFTGSATTKFRQIGNAVPTRLGKVAGEVLKNLLNKITTNLTPDTPQPHYRVIHKRPHVRTKTYWKNGKAFTGSTSYYDKTSEQKERQLTLV